ncbi:MAG: endonuclease/exonuclease/phosphatase family protein [Saprospiraceae bacterium]|nr:endonuclease/exonuclease/phosphatase family protein [Bacteroidia bacterium]NNL92504.1 endonuclease/exonuclease/phosphatase family protein [Saprospiraceae bacterium]
MRFLYLISILTIVGNLLPFSDSKHWFIRGQAYFRFWYLLMNVILILVWIGFFSINVFSFIIICFLILSSAICLKDILPFTKWYKKEVQNCSQCDHKNSLSILVFNVYQKNTAYQKLIDLVKMVDPDIILLLETNNAWAEALKPLDKIYKNCVKVIQENTYGMMLYSKLPSLEEKIERLSDDKIPSIDYLGIINNKKLRIRGLHPRPPIPGEALSSKQKDAEFREAAKIISQLDENELKIVIGDLNDVVWSKASKKFKNISGLKDPRVGRSTLSTFPTYSPIRFPLDHIFCSSELLISDFKVLENIGSDHFPVYIRFCVPD